MRRRNDTTHLQTIKLDRCSASTNTVALPLEMLHLLESSFVRWYMCKTSADDLGAFIYT